MFFIFCVSEAQLHRCRPQQIQSLIYLTCRKHLKGFLHYCRSPLFRFPHCRRSVHPPHPLQHNLRCGSCLPHRLSIYVHTLARSCTFFQLSLFLMFLETFYHFSIICDCVTTKKCTIPIFAHFAAFLCTFSMIIFLFTCICLQNFFICFYCSKIYSQFSDNTPIHFISGCLMFPLFYEKTFGKIFEYDIL